MPSIETRGKVIFPLRRVGAGTNQMSSSQIYIDVVENVTPNRLVLNTRRSDINVFTFPSKDNNETKSHAYIGLTGEFSLVKISVQHRWVES